MNRNEKVEALEEVQGFDRRRRVGVGQARPGRRGARAAPMYRTAALLLAGLRFQQWSGQHARPPPEERLSTDRANNAGLGLEARRGRAAAPPRSRRRALL
ncbi:hypothetical protein EVAR_77874_1 [Eumeta japonica]|uniref:Uncharacterized protein n=1 Tax=Eumeta variegata TaxID=151549 RepID=A0A4C1TEA6_EUMVA|nr:hypothetical protein EVAR_77874_1 [Eumeta japonica]